MGQWLPILHLNGYKIANPTVLGAVGVEELQACLLLWLSSYLVKGQNPKVMHKLMAETLDTVYKESEKSSTKARTKA